MSAATLVLHDPRPARGKHRTRPSVGDLAARLLASWRSARLEFAVAASSLGAVAAMVTA